MLQHRSKVAIRCNWAKPPLLETYHDTEWGVPLHDDNKLFEFLVLGGVQAGLSWEIVLRKRDAFREAFLGFDIARVARFRKPTVERLLRNPAIIRNRRKIEAAVANAKAALAVENEFGSFDSYLWQFVGGLPIQNHWQSWDEAPAHSAESDAMSEDLRARGFKFAGSTICYAFMQAVGMVNDHQRNCFRHKEIARA